MGVPKFLQMGLLQVWRHITWCVNLWLQWGLKQSYSPCQELSNRMSDVASTQGNRVESWLLVVKNQTASLTPSLSFGHNLCFKCPNGQFEPIFNIYALITFQWYKKLFNAMGFDPWNYTLKIQESIWDYNSQHGSSRGSVRVHSLTLFAFPGACDVTPGSFSWPTTLQPLASVAGPRLRLQHLPYSIIYLAIIFMIYHKKKWCILTIRMPSLWWKQKMGRRWIEHKLYTTVYVTS
jgi:hypothetical protein